MTFLGLVLCPPWRCFKNISVLFSLLMSRCTSSLCARCCSVSSTTRSLFHVSLSFLDFVVLGNTIQVDPALVRGKLQPCAFLSRIFRLLRGTTIWAIGNISSEVCHPAVKRTCLVIKQRFWWPAIEKEVGEFVAVRQVWARNKVSRHPLAGLLCPLPVPHRLWSDI